jgi:hypothetical protein
MELQVILCDVTRVSEGKLDLLGAGWTAIRGGQVQFGIGIIATVPWSELDVEHTVEFVLADDKGAVVTSPNGDPLLRGEFKFKGQKPVGVLLGAPAVVPIPINLTMELPYGKRMKVVVTADGHGSIDWEAAFSTQPDPGPQQLAM